MVWRGWARCASVRDTIRRAVVMRHERSGANHVVNLTLMDGSGGCASCDRCNTQDEQYKQTSYRRGNIYAFFAAALRFPGDGSGTAPAAAAGSAG